MSDIKACNVHWEQVPSPQQAINRTTLGDDNDEQKLNERLKDVHNIFWASGMFCCHTCFFTNNTFFYSVVSRRGLPVDQEQAPSLWQATRMALGDNEWKVNKRQVCFSCPGHDLFFTNKFFFLFRCQTSACNVHHDRLLCHDEQHAEMMNNQQDDEWWGQAWLMVIYVYYYYVYYY